MYFFHFIAGIIQCVLIREQKETLDFKTFFMRKRENILHRKRSTDSKIEIFMDFSFDTGR